MGGERTARERIPAVEVEEARALVVALDASPHQATIRNCQTVALDAPPPRIEFAGPLSPAMQRALVALGAVESEPQVWTPATADSSARCGVAFGRLGAGAPTSTELARAAELARLVDVARCEVVWRAEPPASVRGLLRRLGMRPERVTVPDVAGYVWRWTCTEPQREAAARAVLGRIDAVARGGAVVDIDMARAASRPAALAEPPKASIASDPPVLHSPEWAATLAELRAVVGAEFFASTFGGLTLAGDTDGDGWTVEAWDEIRAHVIRKSYLGVIEACAQRATGRAVTVAVRYVGEEGCEHFSVDYCPDCARRDGVRAPGLLVVPAAGARP